MDISTANFNPVFLLTYPVLKLFFFFNEVIFSKRLFFEIRVSSSITSSSALNLSLQTIIMSKLSRQCRVGCQICRTSQKQSVLWNDAFQPFCQLSYFPKPLIRFFSFFEMISLGYFCFLSFESKSSQSIIRLCSS